MSTSPSSATSRLPVTALETRRRPSPHRARRDGAAAVSAVLVLVVLVVGAWRRRWMADDGLIVLRTVRNLLAGNGPVFNAGERVESNTSALWTYVVAAFGWVPGPLEMTTVVLCLTLTVVGVLLGVLAARELHGSAGLLVPVGALTYVALPPARDFATSGMEVGLVLTWLGGLALLLARRARRGTPGGEVVLGVVAGLAPLVRPELTVVAGLAGVLVLAGPSAWRRRLLVVVAGAVVPAGYELFRMGYYGLPYPVTAVAKEASDSQWSRGWGYVADLVGTYALWVVLLVVLGLAALVVLNRGRGQADEADAGHDHGVQVDTNKTSARAHWALRPGSVTILLVSSGVLYTIYVARVGGDFMHGRMLLPALFLLLLPGMVVPVPRGRPVVTTASVALVVVGVGWAGVTLVSAGPSYYGVVSASGVVDERAYWTEHTENTNPITAEDYIRGNRLMQGIAPALAELDGRGGLVRPGKDQYEPWLVDVSPDPTARPTVFLLNIGMASMSVSLDVRVEDIVGLSNPVAAHSEPVPGGRVGHDKAIPPDWDGARVGLQPATTTTLDPRQLGAAQQALTCRLTREMVDSYTAPLTLRRVVQNIRGSLSRAAYRYPKEAFGAIAACGS